MESWHFGAAESLDQVSFLYRGQFCANGRDFSVTAAAAPRMGMVAAATLTQKMIQRVRPRLIAMTGIRQLAALGLASPHHCGWSAQRGGIRGR
jgi:nucleoside phosphorylase